MRLLPHQRDAGGVHVLLLFNCVRNSVRPSMLIVSVDLEKVNVRPVATLHDSSTVTKPSGAADTW